MYEITDSIQDLKNMLVSNDSSLILGYSSRNDEFRNAPLKLIVTLPDFFSESDQHG